MNKSKLFEVFLVLKFTDAVYCPGSYMCDYSNTSVMVSQAATNPPHSYSSSSLSDDESNSFIESSSSFSSSLDDGYLPQARCIPQVQVCDGAQDCPNSDDEVQCGKRFR